MPEGDIIDGDPNSYKDGADDPFHRRDIHRSAEERKARRRIEYEILAPHRLRDGVIEPLFNFSSDVEEKQPQRSDDLTDSIVTPSVEEAPSAAENMSEADPPDSKTDNAAETQAGIEKPLSDEELYAEFKETVVATLEGETEDPVIQSRIARLEALIATEEGQRTIEAFQQRLQREQSDTVIANELKQYTPEEILRDRKENLEHLESFARNKAGGIREGRTYRVEGVKMDGVTFEVFGTNAEIRENERSDYLVCAVKDGIVIGRYGFEVSHPTISSEGKFIIDNSRYTAKGFVAVDPRFQSQGVGGALNRVARDTMQHLADRTQKPVIHRPTNSNYNRSLPGEAIRWATLFGDAKSSGKTFLPDRAKETSDVFATETISLKKDGNVDSVGPKTERYTLLELIENTKKDLAL